MKNKNDNKNKTNSSNINNIFGKNTILLVLLSVLGLLSLQYLFMAHSEAPTEITYNQYRSKLLQKEVKEVKLRPKNDSYLIKGKFKDDKEFYTRGPSPISVGNTVIQDLDSQGIKYENEERRDEHMWANLLWAVLPMAMVGGICYFLFLKPMRGEGNPLTSIGKSKAKSFDINSDKKKITFNDVAGADTEKAELIEVVDFLKDSRRYVSMGARIPAGVLLVGPPGTGKTLLARAVAGEAKVPFFSLSGSEFVEMFVGVGASRVRDLFDKAKKNSPCILFIDEIDAIGRRRGSSHMGGPGGNDERDQTLNQLLVEMDGFEENSGIIIMAATNRSDVLDPALLRPGRFDRQISFTLPTVEGREKILELHAANKPLADKVDLKKLATRTTGFSGADLENLLNEAALLSARHKKTKITLDELDEATDRVLMGPQKTTMVVSDKQRKIVSYHEAGHVVVGYKLGDADIVHKVTIVPRGPAALGYAMILPREDRYISTKQELLDRITGILGGRVAEEVIFNEISTGAGGDFEQAADIARSMVTIYGMSDELPTVAFGRLSEKDHDNAGFGAAKCYSEETAFKIDKEIEAIIRHCYAKAKSIIEDNRDRLELLAKTLMERETLVSEQITELMENGCLQESEDVKVNIKKKDKLKKNDKKIEADNDIKPDKPDKK